jgi:2-phospho-L-lactate/phosphoenolpyruvate guanylyltransferase
MSVVAVLPVKELARAKARLGESGVGPAARVALATGMLMDVFEALDRSRLVDDVIVVSSDHHVEVLARSYGNQVIPDNPLEGHSEAALRGIAWAIDEGAFHALVLAGDTPAIDDAEIDELLRRLADGPEVVIIPDRHGSGTNALLLTPPEVMAPSFGPGSRERHEALAREAGADVRVAELDSLALDIDTADDLEALAHGLAGAPRQRAQHTRNAINSMRRL